MSIAAKLVEASKAGNLVSCRWPHSGTLSIALERHMVEDAMKAWRSMTDDDRAIRMESVRIAIKRVTKRLKRDRATPQERNELAADIALWLGHELVYGNGEQWLIKGMSTEDLAASVAKAKH